MSNDLADRKPLAVLIAEIDELARNADSADGMSVSERADTIELAKLKDALVAIWPALRDALATLERTESALRELVRLKDIKDRIDAMPRWDTLLPDEIVQAGKLLDDYDRNKPLAWEVARAVLNPAESTQEPQ